MTRPTFCRGTGQPSEKCDYLRCRSECYSEPLMAANCTTDETCRPLWQVPYSVHARNRRVSEDI